jgi:AcrR family transcriptional regulator
MEAGETTRRKRISKPAGERRAEILEAAVALFRERGFDETTIQDIADASEVGTGTFYLYFPSKEHALLAIHEQFHEGLVQAFKEAVEEIGARAAAGEVLDHRTVIDVIFDAEMGYNVRNRHLLDVMCRFDPRLTSDEVRELDQQHFKFMADSFRLGTEAGFIHTDDADAVAYLLGSVNIALAESVAFGDTPSLERLVAQAKTMYYAALAPPGAEAGPSI